MFATILDESSFSGTMIAASVVGSCVISSLIVATSLTFWPPSTTMISSFGSLSNPLTTLSTSLSPASMAVLNRPMMPDICCINTLRHSSLLASAAA